MFQLSVMEPMMCNAQCMCRSCPRTVVRRWNSKTLRLRLKERKNKRWLKHGTALNEPRRACRRKQRKLRNSWFNEYALRRRMHQALRVGSTALSSSHVKLLVWIRRGSCAFHPAKHAIVNAKHPKHVVPHRQPKNCHLCSDKILKNALGCSMCKHHNQEKNK